MVNREPIWIVLAILTFIAAVLINYYNNLRDAKNGHINHSRALKIKIASCIIPVLIVASFSNFRWIWALLTAIFLVGALFVLFFEGIWGIKVANDFFYRSTAVGKNKSETDQWVQFWPKWLYIAVKIAMVLLSMYVYHIGLTK